MRQRPVITAQVAERLLLLKHLLISLILYAQPFVDLLLPCPLLCQPSAEPETPQIEC